MHEKVTTVKRGFQLFMSINYDFVSNLIKVHVRNYRCILNIPRGDFKRILSFDQLTKGSHNDVKKKFITDQRNREGNA